MDGEPFLTGSNIDVYYKLAEENIRRFSHRVAVSFD